MTSSLLGDIQPHIATSKVLLPDDLVHHTSDEHDPFLPPMKLLASQKWTSRIFLVFDISNSSYDPHKGQLPEQNNLPPVVVRLGGGRGGERVQAYG